MENSLHPLHTQGTLSERRGTRPMERMAALSPGPREVGNISIQANTTHPAVECHGSWQNTGFLRLKTYNAECKKQTKKHAHQYECIAHDVFTSMETNTLIRGPTQFNPITPLHRGQVEFFHFSMQARWKPCPHDVLNHGLLSPPFSKHMEHTSSTTTTRTWCSSIETTALECLDRAITLITYTGYVREPTNVNKE